MEHLDTAAATELLGQAHGIRTPTCCTSGREDREGGLSGARISQEARHVCRASVVAAAGKRSPPGPADSDPDSDRAALLLAGFTSSQAARTLAWFSLYGKALSIDNVQAWVQLLHDCQVLQPVVAISASPMVLEMRADNLAASAAAAAGWMLSKGVTPLQMSEVITKHPLVLVVSHDNLVAVDAWLRAELGWTDGLICAAIVDRVQLFCLRPSTLAPKLQWLRRTGFAEGDVGKMLASYPSILLHAVEHNAAQLSALRALGLSHPQAVAAIVRTPQLLRLNISGAKQQAKLAFLARVMGRGASELTTCSKFLTYSLFGRIGPRWAFVDRYCSASRWPLSTLLAPREGGFVARLKSPSLDEECASRGLTRAQRYQEFVAEWQLGEGREWLVQDGRKSGVGGGDPSPDGDALGREPRSAACPEPYE
ncbi:MAG: hypothetical protein WDW36_008132 [Sanguina aurantia]